MAARIGRPAAPPSAAAAAMGHAAPSHSPAKIAEAYEAVVDAYMSRENYKISSSLLRIYDITVLHAAVIIGSLEIVQRCFTVLKNNVNATDKRGFTALHHCALLSDGAAKTAIKALLLSKGADANIRDVFGNTPDDLFACTTLPPDSREGLTTIFERNAEGEFIPVSREAYSRMTRRAIYTPLVHSTITYEVQTWARGVCPKPLLFISEVPATKLCNELKTAYLVRLKRPHFKPKMVIRQVDRDASGKPIVNLGVSMTPATTIPPATYLEVYTGLTDRKHLPSMYRASDVDALRYGNEVSLFNDGFPNTAFWEMQENRVLFFSLTKIDFGDWICSDYGGEHPVKLMTPYIELRPAELRHFVKNELPKYMPGYHYHQFRMEKPPANAREELEILRIIEGLRYLFNTPAVIFNLILDSTLSVRDARRLFSTALKEGRFINLNLGSPLPEQDPKVVLNLCDIAAAAFKMKTELAEVVPELSTAYFAYVQSLPSQYGVITGLQMATNAHAFLDVQVKRIKALPEKDRAAEWSKLTPSWEAHLKEVLSPMGERYLKALSEFFSTQGRG